MTVNLLLTGGSGFLGRRIAESLSAKTCMILTAAVHRNVEVTASHTLKVRGLDANTDWSSALSNQHVVIHAAGRAHIMNDEVSDPSEAYRRVNVYGTLNFARQASSAGIKRFIFISSIGVNGNINTQPFREDDTPNPGGLYAQSKWEAEQGLWDIQKKTGMEIVIIRPPLVYGRNAPGNFGSLMRWVEGGIPLPLGAINNQRSLVGLDNLVDLIITCIGHPAAANQVFLAGDGKDQSTSEWLRGVAKAAGKPSKLIPVPSSLLMLSATFLGKKAIAQRLLGSLQIDISKARDLLDWEPPISVEEGLERCFIKD